MYLQNETVWLTQNAMEVLFDVNLPTISKHLSNIFQEGELNENSVISISETTIKYRKVKYISR